MIYSPHFYEAECEKLGFHRDWASKNYDDLSPTFQVGILLSGNV